MTGYGKSQASLTGKTITVEIRSLNSKTLDLNLRIPPVYREKEMDIRSLVSQKLERGKVDVTITLESNEEEPAVAINQGLALKYYRQIKELSAQMPETRMDDLLGVLVRMPEVLKAEKDELKAEEWSAVSQAIARALHDLDAFRLAEGKMTHDDMLHRISQILGLLTRVGPYEKQRVESFRAKFIAHLEELLPDQGYDTNRLEQELIYYFEKLDITEEKVRLKKHCDYFIDAMDEKESPGKKLGFITQEIGREINTLGSKANDAHIQKLVVQMKDELEKIKEQLANIL